MKVIWNGIECDELSRDPESVARPRVRLGLPNGGGVMTAHPREVSALPAPVPAQSLPPASPPAPAAAVAVADKGMLRGRKPGR